MCGDNCPLECDSVEYTTSASSVVYPSDMFATMLQNNWIIQEKFDGRQDVTASELRSNILALNVFYSSLSYHSFTESPKTELVDLISNIGGTMGLFLGVSFLSFVEIFDLMACLFVVFKHKSSGTKFINIDPNRQPVSLGQQSTAFGYTGGFGQQQIQQQGFQQLIQQQQQQQQDQQQNGNTTFSLSTVQAFPRTLTQVDN